MVHVQVLRILPLMIAVLAMPQNEQFESESALVARNQEIEDNVNKSGSNKNENENENETEDENVDVDVDVDVDEDLYKALDYAVDDDVVNHGSILATMKNKKVYHNPEWLKPLADKFQNLLQIINHPNDVLGIHHVLTKIAEKTDKFFGAILSHHHPTNGYDYPFPYKLKK